jgi:hypothetical protein
VQAVQPSVADVAPEFIVTYVPGAQFCEVQEVDVPPVEYVPIGHTVQSVAEVAPILSAIYPAGQFVGEHEVAPDDADYEPALHKTH